MNINFDPSKLLNWFHKEKKDYPWSLNKSPYLVWISEIMLQQTVAASVIPYFNTWLEKFPQVQYLANTDLDELLALWEGLGYYSRCRNIHKAAIIIVENYKGIMPSTYKELRQLPGIGDYTARAILSIAYKKPYVVFDANVRRIVQRLTASEIWDKKNDKIGIEILERMIPHDYPGDFNEALMQLGQLVCTSNNPKCPICPINTNCLAYKRNLCDKIPLKKTKTINKKNSIVLLLAQNGYIVLGKKIKGLFHDLYLPPRVDLDKSEFIEWGTLDLAKKTGKILQKRNHLYTNNKESLYPHLFQVADDFKETSFPIKGDCLYQWVEINDLDSYAVPSVYRKILNEMTALL